MMNPFNSGGHHQAERGGSQGEGVQTRSDRPPLPRPWPALPHQRLKRVAKGQEKGDMSPARRPPRSSGALSSSHFLPPALRLLPLLAAQLLLLQMQPSKAEKKPEARSDSSSDVCATCHVNATCQQENGKKFCKCNYGLSGNGRTFCEDKDECKTGMGKICGEHASCHNTHGSYYCVCLEGFQASNKRRQFIPNDGTNCTVVDCGPPPVLSNAYLAPFKETTYGSKVIYTCLPGKYNWTAVCNSSGLWEQTNMVCKEVNCGRPFWFPNTEISWDNTTTLGSTIYYKCREGFWTESKRNFSMCTLSQRWENITFECKGKPQEVPMQVAMTWMYPAAAKSLLLLMLFFMKKISCGTPPLINNSVIIWNNMSQVGNMVEYKCQEGFYGTSTKKHAFCTKNGTWETLDLRCEKLQDFLDFAMNDTCMTWKRLKGNTTINETYQLTVKKLGLESEKSQAALDFNLTTSEEAIKICLQLQDNVNYSVQVTTQSTNLALKLQRFSPIIDSPTQLKSNKEDQGDDPGITTVPSSATKIKEVFRNISVYNDTCIKWQRELGETQTQKDYVIRIHGLRWYQKHFSYKKTYNFTTGSETPEICFNLPPGSNYTVNISTTKMHHSVLVNMSTPITDPPPPEVEFISVRGSVPPFRLKKAEEQNGPISSYQVIVIPWHPQCNFNCYTLASLTYFNQRSDSQGYVAAEIPARVVTDNMLDFALGDRLYYGEFYNAPLTQGKDYCVVLRTVSEWNMVKTQSCVVWAQIKDLSSSPQHIAIVILVSAAALCCILIIALGVACAAVPLSALVRRTSSIETKHLSVAINITEPSAAVSSPVLQTISLSQ